MTSTKPKHSITEMFSGASVLAVPGVNLLTHLKSVLAELKIKGVTKIQTAFDMDFSTNINVQNGFNKLLSLLDDMGFRFGTYVWDPNYKGLDDFIRSQK